LTQPHKGQRIRLQEISRSNSQKPPALPSSHTSTAQGLRRRAGSADIAIKYKIGAKLITEKTLYPNGTSASDPLQTVPRIMSFEKVRCSDGMNNAPKSQCKKNDEDTHV
jgi:hypothetical protein